MKSLLLGGRSNNCRVDAVMTDDGFGIYMYCGMIGLNRRCWTQRYQELMLSL